MQTVAKAKAMPKFRLKVWFAHGFTGEVDLKDHIQKSDWPIVQPLTQPNFFRRVRVQDGSVVWPNGYDICPDVLRFWCEVARATSQAETDAHFAVEKEKAAMRSWPGQRNPAFLDQLVQACIFKSSRFEGMLTNPLKRLLPDR